MVGKNRKGYKVPRKMYFQTERKSRKIEANERG
jgi:hypothetical protein